MTKSNEVICLPGGTTYEVVLSPRCLVTDESKKSQEKVLIKYDNERDAKMVAKALEKGFEL